MDINTENLRKDLQFLILKQNSYLAVPRLEEVLSRKVGTPPTDLSETLQCVIFILKIDGIENHPKKLIQVDIQPLSVEVKIWNHPEADYYFKIDRLSNEIEVASSSYEIASGTLTLFLAKVEQAMWASIYYHDPEVIANYKERMNEYILNPILKSRANIIWNIRNLEHISHWGMDLKIIILINNITAFCSSSRKVTEDEVIDYMKSSLTYSSDDKDFIVFAYAVYLKEKSKFEESRGASFGKERLGKNLNNRKGSHSENKEAEELKNKGNRLFKARKFDEAIEAFTQAIKLDPKCAMYYFNRSVVYFHNTNWIDCINDALETVTIDPFNGKACWYMGKCFRLRFQLEQSIKFFLRAKLLDANNKIIDEEIDKTDHLNDVVVLYIKSVQLGNDIDKNACINTITEIMRTECNHISAYFSGAINATKKSFCDFLICNVYWTMVNHLIAILCSKGMISHAKVEARILADSQNFVEKAGLSILLGICSYYEDNEDEVYSNFKALKEAPKTIFFFFFYKSEVEYCSAIEQLYFLRRKGNESFDSGRYEDAIKWYKMGLENNLTIPLMASRLFCKIAYAKLKLHEEEESLLYLNKAIEKNDNYDEAIAARGEYYLRQRKFSEALNNFERANKLHSCDRYRELINKAKLKHSLSSSFDDDESDLKEMSLHKSLANCKKGKGNKHFDDKRYNEAIEAYSEAIALDSTNPIYFSNRAACHIMLKDFKEGLKDSERALEIDSSFVKGLYRLGICHIALGRPDEAITALEKALKAKPNDGSVRTERVKAKDLKEQVVDGDFAYNAKNYEAAAQYFTAALSKAEVCIELRLKRIDCLIHMEMFDEALVEADLTKNLDPDSSELFYYMGLAYFYNQEKDKSIKCFEKSLALKWEDRVSEILKTVNEVYKLKDLGDEACKENKSKEALSYYQEGLKQDIRNKKLNSYFYFNIGLIYMRENENEEAINYLTSVIDLQAENIEAYKRRAECYLKLELLKKALHDYEKVNKIVPNKDHEVLVREIKEKINNLSKNMSEEELESALSKYKQEKGEKYFVEKNFKDALDCYTDALHLDSGNILLYLSRSNCYMALKNYRAALADAREALKRDDKCLQGFILSGECHIIVGNAEEAIFAFEQAKKLEAGNKKVVEGIQKALKLKQCLDIAENAFKEERIGKAYDMYKCVSRIAIGCSSVLLKVAECLIKLQRLPALSKLIDSVHGMLWESSEYFCIQGLYSYHQDKMADTIKYLERAVEVDSANKKCKNYLDKIQSVYKKKQKGNDAFVQMKYDEAFQYYKEGLKIETDNLIIQSKFQYNIGMILKKRNMFAEALDYFTTAINLRKDYTNALEMRAQCYTKMDELEKAIEEYNDLYKLTNSKKYLTLMQDLEKQLTKKSTKLDYYKILRVPPKATMTEIRTSYKVLAKEFHPDRLVTEVEKEMGGEKFKEINEAYSVLSDPLKREKYDRGETDIPFTDFNFNFPPFMYNPFAGAFFRFLEREFTNNPFFH